MIMNVYLLRSTDRLVSIISNHFPHDDEENIYSWMSDSAYSWFKRSPGYKQNYRIKKLQHISQIFAYNLILL